MKKIFAVAAAIGCFSALADTWTDSSTGIEWTYTLCNGEATVGGLDSSTTAIPKNTSGAVTIPATLGGSPVVCVGDYAFRGCSNLTSVTIQNGVGILGSSAFENCTGLTSVSIGSGVTNIWCRPFSGCRSLATIQVSSSNPNYKASSGHLLTKDGKTLVCGTKGSNGTVTIPSGVTTIGDYAFEGQGALAGVTIPADVASIGIRAFADCPSLASATIGSGVKAIGEGAFSGCRSLASATIPAGVTSIGDWAFADCTGLSNISKVTFAGGMDGIEMNVWRAFVGTPWLDAYVAAMTKPGNDNRASAVTLSGRSGIATGSNVGAGVEDGEALCSVWAAAAPAWWGWKTIWWKWTAPSSETFKFLTKGSGFDTVLGVFKSGSGNALVLVGDSDDAFAGGASSVSFSAVKDTTYYIAVGGYESQMGDIVLRWQGATEDQASYGQLATNAYAKSMSIQFNFVPQGVTLTNFPALVKLSTSITGFSYSDFRKAKGGDLRFADATGAILPHEIDTWDEGGVSTVWVKVPRLVKDTTITAYYGCSGTPEAVDPKDVWDDDYVGVWHLGESALPLQESSMTSSDFEVERGPGVGYAAPGVVGGSVDFGAPGCGKMLDAPDHDALDGFTKCTFEIWTFPTNRPTSGDKNTGILSKRNGYAKQASYHFTDNGSGGVSVVVSSNSTTHTTAAGISSVAANAWNHLAVTFDAGSQKNYRNGASAGTGTVAVKKINAGTADLHLGDFHPTDARNFPGRIDEVRISKVARSAAWVKATHDTIAGANPATYTVNGCITPTELVTLTTREYTTQAFGGKTVRRYRNLIYGTRDDAAGEGSQYVGAEGEYNRHRSGNYYDIFIAESFLNSPEALADMPVFIYLHGGSWSEKYDKDGSNGDFLGRVATNGYAVITMDYQLQNEMSMTGGGFTPRANASFADMLGDIDTLLTYLKAQLPTIGMTNTRVVIGGDSAGAHLSMCYAWDQNGPNRLSGVSLRHDLDISCVTSIVGPSDLAAIFGQQLAMYSLLPPEQQAAMATSLDFFGGLIGADVASMLASGDTAAAYAVLAAWSPVGLVDSESCHAILSYGYTGDTLTESSTDGVVPISNFNSLTNAFAASGVSYDARLFNMDHGSLSGGSEPSATWIVEKLGALRESFQNEEPERILYVDVDGIATTNTLNYALVTEYITNIVKRGTGTLVAGLTNYVGDITLEGGVFKVEALHGAGKHSYANNIYVGPNASLHFAGDVNDILNNKKIVFEGVGASSAPLSAKFFNANRKWVTIGVGMSFTFKTDAKFAVGCWNRMILKNVDVDMQGHNLTLSCSPGNQVEFSGSTFRNPGNIIAAQGMAFYEGTGNNTFTGTGEIRLRDNSSYLGNGTVSASGWTIVATNTNTKIGGYSNKFPTASTSGEWNGKIVFGRHSASLCYYTGGSGNTVLSNTVFNVKGPMSGSAPLKVGPGWLNLHTSAASNTSSGAVTVTGRTPSNLTPDYPILAGGGGIGLWNGAACFPNASSITFTNTARLAFMDNTACTVPTVKFVALAGETQSISGGVKTARSTVAGIVKEGAGTLVVDSPMQVTGLADVKAGTLKIAYCSDTTAQTQEAMLEPMPQFASLKFASGTKLDLSDNVGMVLNDLEGSPVVTNSGMFGISGKWKLTTPGDVLAISSEHVEVGGQGGVMCFLPGATFDLADEAAFKAAVAAAGPDGLLVAEANWILDPSNEQLQGSVVLPSPAQSLGAGWSMAIGKGRGDDYAGRGLYLRYSDPSASGYAAWIAGKGITGANAAADKVTNGIANGVRYAFDIDPATSEIGTPILDIGPYQSGNLAVKLRALADGRSDVMYGVLASETLDDWAHATFVSYSDFTEGTLAPSAVKNPAPAQMFFKYKIDIQQ